MVKDSFLVILSSTLESISMSSHVIYFSHISYACQIWAQHETYITRRTFLLQKRAVRLISMLTGFLILISFS